MSGFGATVRKLRENAKISLRDLANAVGVSAVYLSDIERGRRNPPQDDKLKKIADFLHINPQELEELAIKDRKRVELELPSDRGTVSDAALALARRWDYLTDAQAAAIIEICNQGGSQ